MFCVDDPSLLGWLLASESRGLCLAAPPWVGCVCASPIGLARLARDGVPDTRVVEVCTGVSASSSPPRASSSSTGEPSSCREALLSGVSCFSDGIALGLSDSLLRDLRVLEIVLGGVVDCEQHSKAKHAFSAASIRRPRRLLVHAPPTDARTPAGRCRVLSAAS